MMKLSITSALIVFGLLTFSASYSAEIGDSERKEFATLCASNPADAETIKIAKKYFPAASLEVVKIRNDVCNENIPTSSEELIIRITSLLDVLADLFPGTNVNLEFKNIERKRFRETGELGFFFVEPIEIDDEVQIVISMNQEQLFETKPHINGCNELVKRIDSEATCKTALEAFEDLYEFAHTTFAQPLVLKVVNNLSQIKAEWEDFYKNSRSQTLLEMTYNGKKFRESVKNHPPKFMPPPDSQTILFHPGIVIENVSDAADGDEAKEAIMLEIWGKSYWKRKGWIPSGYSLVVLLSDRADQDDIAYGAAFHFNNKLTLGFSLREDSSDDSGIFVSYDLLKGFQDKREVLESYRGKLDEFTIQ